MDLARWKTPTYEVSLLQSRVWNRCKPATHNPIPFRARGLDPEVIKAHDLARFVTQDAVDLLTLCEKPQFRTIHPGDILMPTVNIAGDVLSWRRIVWDAQSPSKWRKLGAVTYDNSPSTIRGNVLWNRKSGLYYEGKPDTETSVNRGVIHARDVVLVEGEPDFLTACSMWPDHAVIGIHNGAWTDGWALTHLHPKSRIFLMFHEDKAGDRYVKAVWDTLHRKANLFRFSNYKAQASYPMGSPVEWMRESFDLNDLLVRGILKQGSVSPADLCDDFEEPSEWHIEETPEWMIEPVAPSRRPREVKLFGDPSDKVREHWIERLVSATRDMTAGKYDADRYGAMKEINALIGAAGRGLLDMQDVLHGIKSGYILTKSGETRDDRKQVVKSCYHHITGQRLALV